MFNERLRLTRESMKLNQEEFAVLGGVKISAQANYERGLRFPSLEYLLNLSDKGIDVSYLMTGVISDNKLNSLEKELLIAYRKGSQDKKNALIMIARSPEISQQDDNNDSNSERELGAQDIKQKSKLNNKQTLFSLYRWNDMKVRAGLLLKTLPIILLAALSIVIFSYILTNEVFVEKNSIMQMTYFIAFSIVVSFVSIKYLDHTLKLYESNMFRMQVFGNLLI